MRAISLMLKKINDEETQTEIINNIHNQYHNILTKQHINIIDEKTKLQIVLRQLIQDYLIPEFKQLELTDDWTFYFDNFIKIEILHKYHCGTDDFSFQYRFYMIIEKEEKKRRSNIQGAHKLLARTFRNSFIATFFYYFQ